MIDLPVRRFQFANNSIFDMKFFMESVLTPVNKQGFAWHLAHRQPYQPPASTILSCRMFLLLAEKGSVVRVFPRPFTHGGGGQSVNGGTHEVGHRPYGGGTPNFHRLYHKLKVLLLLSCNYMMQFISYDSINTR